MLRLRRKCERLRPEASWPLARERQQLLRWREEEAAEVSANEVGHGGQGVAPITSYVTHLTRNTYVPLHSPA